MPFGPREIVAEPLRGPSSLHWLGTDQSGRDLLAREGPRHVLEGALQDLRAAGVYVSYEEFKGRTPMVREGRVFPVRPEDFDNPHAPRHYAGESSGTTGRSSSAPAATRWRS